MALKDLHRSPQLDALSIDNEVIRILEDKAGTLLARCNIGSGIAVGVLVRLVVHVLCFLRAAGQTVGMGMLHVKLTGFGRLTLAIYSLGRVVEYLLAEKSLLCRQVIHLLNTVSFVVFLRTGKYPDFLLALLGIKVERSCDEQVGGFSHEYIVRRLLWEQLAKLASRVDLQMLRFKPQKDTKVTATLNGCNRCGNLDVPVLFKNHACKERIDHRSTPDRMEDDSVESKGQPGEERLLLLPKWARVVGHDDEDDTLDINRAHMGAGDDQLALKSDHASRPLWITSDGVIIMEALNVNSESAQDFLTAIAEPVTRPAHIHEYRLTPYSLYAAVSVGMETEDIIGVLDGLCKTVLPERLVKFIRNCTTSYGKIKLVLRENKYLVESTHPEVIRLLLNDPVIVTARPPPEVLAASALDEDQDGDSRVNVIDRILTIEESIESDEEELHEQVANGGQAGKAFPNTRTQQTISVKVHSFEILPTHVESVKKRCIELDYPMLEEYDFRNDRINPQLPFDLRPTTNIRPYQERALGKLFGNGRARSGIIVLPCGAGKTLVGITASCTIKKSCLVLCTSAVAVEQWRQQFRAFSTLSDQHIARFTSDSKERFSGSAGVVITTYTMIAYSGKRSWEAKKMMDFIRSIEWGFMILDEVHVVPANVFRRVLTSVAAHSKLGLTATLVREDDKIDDLNFLIGPKLYEANWLDLSRQGHIASVQCAEVWCSMSACFYREYLRERDSRKRRLLYVMNPGKIQMCQFLIDFHEKRGDKIIVFSDNVYALKKYANLLRCPYIYGATSQADRMTILQQFQANPNVNTLFLSKVGDTSIDLPEATCLIQISSHYGSRRQEAQRLGRILRAKRRNVDGFNAFFYSLVSRDTEEMFYSAKRQQFLIDQGYSFKVITDLTGINEHPNIHYRKASDQDALLASVLIDAERALSEDNDDDLGSEGEYDAVYRVRPASLKSLTGADSMAYMEVQRPVKEPLSKSKNRHKLFKERDKMH